jgi:hypothetical protein
MKRTEPPGPRWTGTFRHRRVRYGDDWTEYPLLFLRLVSAGLLIALAWVHFHLWQAGYRHIPTIGPLFLMAAVSGTAIAVAMLARSSRFIAVLGVGLAVGVLVGLVMSVNIGLFGFSESLSAPYVIESVALELAAAVTLSSWIVLDAVQGSRQRARARRTGWRDPAPLARPSDRTTVSP